MSAASAASAISAQAASSASIPSPSRTARIGCCIDASPASAATSPPRCPRRKTSPPAAVAGERSHITTIGGWKTTGVRSGFMCVLFRRRHRFAPLSAAAAILSTAIMVGCGGGAAQTTPSGTPARTATFAPQQQVRFTGATDGFLAAVEGFLSDVGGCVQSARFGEAAVVPECVRKARLALSVVARRATSDLSALRAQTRGACSAALGHAAVVPATVMNTLEDVSNAARALEIERVGSLAAVSGGAVTRAAAPWTTAARVCRGTA